MISIKQYFRNLLLVCIVFPSFTFSQTANYKNLEIEQPFLKFYSPKEYKAEPTNWNIAQDKRGVMYFANNSGVLEFDGVSWRLIEVSSRSAVRSIGIDDSGKIYVCVYSDFGYLEPDSVGQLRYKSLLGFLDKKYHDFGEMWDVAISSEGVFFKTKDKIFRWNGSEIKVWNSVYAFRLYNINDKIYSRNNGIGLMMIEGDSIKLMPDGGYFSETGVFDMLPFDDQNSNQNQKILVTTNLSGLFLSDGKKFAPFKTEADSFLINNQIYNTCITADGNFAFATQRGGVAIIDHEGHLLEIINEKSGLSTNVVFDVYPDNQGGLWLATVNGVAHCEVPSPFSLMPNKGLLKNSVYSMLRFEDRMYATNELGVHYLKEGESSFKLVKGSNKPGYKLINAGGILLASTNWGVALIDKDRFKKLITENSTNFLHQSKIYPGRIYVTHRDGLTIIERKENNNRFNTYLTNIDEELISVGEDDDSTLWLQNLNGDIIHVTGKLSKLLPGNITHLVYKRYEANKYLSHFSSNIYSIGDKTLFSTDKGIFRFDKDSESFIHDSTLGTVFTDSTNSILMIEKGRNGELWILANLDGVYELGKAVLQKDGKYKWKPLPEFRRLDLGSVYSIYDDYDSATGNEIIWISTDEGLVRYNQEIKKNVAINYSTLIRKVLVNDDSLIYNGTDLISAIKKEIILPFIKNDVSFIFSAVSFDKPEATLYQYYLEGNDDGWSQWSAESKKEYTNLSSGYYNFRVRAKNVYGIIGTEDIFSFNILPPWYLSWWAYLFYALLLILGVFLTDRIMRRRVIRDERNKAKLREAELIKKQAAELETVDRLVKVINRAENLENLFNSLLQQTLNLLPQAEKAGVFLLNKKDNLFRVEYTAGYKVNDLEKIVFTPDELKRRYTENSDEVEKGIYIIRNTEALFGDDKISEFSKPKSMMVMAVERDENIEAYVVFDSFSERDSFDPSTARILNRFQEHAISAISKAQSLKALQEKNEEIIKTQEQLITQQKLASLGALTAGIAHEIKNPLNFVNNFAELSSEMLCELEENIEEERKNIPRERFNEIKDVINTLKENFKKVNNHGARADSIIKGMLLHSRGSSGEKALTNINDLLDQYVNLAYHGLRAQDKEFNITIEKDYDETIDKINVVPQDISRAFLNVINNACYAANKKKYNNVNNFKPLLKVSTKNLADKIEIHIRDNGCGIPESERKKIFNPFYTTKPAGEGTGLGLSLSYDIIVKSHGGDIKCDSKPGKYTEFIITLPK